MAPRGKNPLSWGAPDLSGGGSTGQVVGFDAATNTSFMGGHAPPPSQPMASLQSMFSGPPQPSTPGPSAPPPAAPQEVGAPYEEVVMAPEPTLFDFGMPVEAPRLGKRKPAYEGILLRNPSY